MVGYNMAAAGCSSSNCFDLPLTLITTAPTNVKGAVAEVDLDTRPMDLPHYLVLSAWGLLGTKAPSWHAVMPFERGTTPK